MALDPSAAPSWFEIGRTILELGIPIVLFSQQASRRRLGEMTRELMQLNDRMGRVETKVDGHLDSDKREFDRVDRDVREVRRRHGREGSDE